MVDNVIHVTPCPKCRKIVNAAKIEDVPGDDDAGTCPRCRRTSSVEQWRSVLG